MPTSDWAVGLADVGAVIRARTKDTGGNELGTFTADTRPTDVQVTLDIAGAVGDLAAEIGADIDPTLWASARRVAAIGAALLVELSHFPEQVAQGRSPYEQLKELYDDRLVKLVKAVSELEGNEGAEVGGTGSPSYGFPANTGGLVGWGTKF